jgi:hypothetical protein
MLSCTTYSDGPRHRHQIVIVIILLAIFATVLAFSARVAAVTPVTAATVSFIGAGVAAAAYAVKVFSPLLLQLLGDRAAASKG